MLTAADLAATFLFALEGSIAATYYQVDVFGVLVLGFSTALVGGVIRDVVIGYTPPASFRTPLYPLVALLGGTIVLLLDRASTDQIPKALLQVTDALGLGLFAAVGAAKALDAGITEIVAVLLGTVSATGGGVVRDVLLNVVPIVLRGEIYAVAALSGAATTVLALGFGTRRWVALTAGFTVCVVFRLVAVRQGWSLPYWG
jgi:uncharacterized membrane protein YeiH